MARESSDRDGPSGAHRRERARHVDHLVVAIDGPAAAGKSAVGSAVARRLDALYFDTGVVYRALTLAALERRVDPDDSLRLAGLAAALEIVVEPPTEQDGRLYDVRLEGRDVTWPIRAPEVDRNVSAVSAHPAVRRALLGVQRRIGRSGRVVMAGRDIGTVVMPNADLKVWLDASLDERARRRQQELASRGLERPFEEVREEMERRDRLDAGRASAPMQAAADAVVVNTDGRSIEQVVDEIAWLATAGERTRHDGIE